MDHDIVDNLPAGSRAADNLAELKRTEPNFTVSEFLEGASSAYEMILMAFENGDLSTVSDFISDDVEEAFQSVIDSRKAASNEEEIKVRFVSEITSVARDAADKIVEGDPNKIKRQKDTWVFAREIGSDNPNWQLVATGA